MTTREFDQATDCILCGDHDAPRPYAGAADVLAWIRGRVAECRRVEDKFSAPRVSRQTRRGAAAVTGPEGVPQAVIEAVAERQALTTVAAMLADQARVLTVGALKDALSPSTVAEFFDDPDWWQFRVTILRRKKMTSTIEARWRHRGASGNEWTAWGQPFDWKRHPETPCRLVLLVDADLDPATRGPL